MMNQNKRQRIAFQRIELKYMGYGHTKTVRSFSVGSSRVVNKRNTEQVTP